MQDIQFHHENEYDRYTVALKVPTKLALQKMLVYAPSPVTFEVGVALCSPKDNFNHRIGREVATNAIIFRTFTVGSVHYQPDGQVVVYFRELNRDFTLTLNFRPERSLVHFTDTYCARNNS